MDDFDDFETEEIPYLNSIGEFTEKPECVIYLSTEPSKVYAIDHDEMQDEDTNDIIHYIMMRNEDVDMSEARFKCYKEQPMVIVKDYINNVDYHSAYIVIH